MRADVVDQSGEADRVALAAGHIQGGLGLPAAVIDDDPGRAAGKIAKRLEALCAKERAEVGDAVSVGDLLGEVLLLQLREHFFPAGRVWPLASACKYTDSHGVMFVAARLPDVVVMLALRSDAPAGMGVTVVHALHE